MIRYLTLLIVACGLVIGAAAAAPIQEKQEPNLLTIVDGTGKEHKVQTWKFVNGTKRLSWLPPSLPKSKRSLQEKGPAGIGRPRGTFV